MIKNTFWAKLHNLLEFPFKINDVKEIEENCETLYITLDNGEVYYISINKYEKDENK